MREFVQKAKNVLLGLVLFAIWVAVVGRALEEYTGMPVNRSLPTDVVYYLVFACVIAPLWEEAVYRYAPITLSNDLGIKNSLPIIILSSYLFGIAHGYVIYSIMIQGVMGLTASIIYEANGNSYLSSVAFHSGWNLLVGFIPAI